MGKGDKKTRRGKIHRGTYGVLRPRGKKAAIVTTSKKAKPKKTTKAKMQSKALKKEDDTKNAVIGKV